MIAENDQKTSTKSDDGGKLAVRSDLDDDSVIGEVRVMLVSKNSEEEIVTEVTNKKKKGQEKSDEKMQVTEVGEDELKGNITETEVKDDKQNGMVPKDAHMTSSPKTQVSKVEEESNEIVTKTRVEDELKRNVTETEVKEDKRDGMVPKDKESPPKVQVTDPKKAPSEYKIANKNICLFCGVIIDKGEGPNGLHHDAFCRGIQANRKNYFCECGCTFWLQKGLTMYKKNCTLLPTVGARGNRGQGEGGQGKRESEVEEDEPRINVTEIEVSENEQVKDDQHDGNVSNDVKSLEKNPVSELEEEPNEKVRKTRVGDKPATEDYKDGKFQKDVKSPSKTQGTTQGTEVEKEELKGNVTGKEAKEDKEDGKFTNDVTIPTGTKVSEVSEVEEEPNGKVAKTRVDDLVKEDEQESSKVQKDVKSPPKEQVSEEVVEVEEDPNQYITTTEDKEDDQVKEDENDGNIQKEMKSRPKTQGTEVKKDELKGNVTEIEVKEVGAEDPNEYVTTTEDKENEQVQEDEQVGNVLKDVKSPPITQVSEVEEERNENLLKTEVSEDVKEDETDDKVAKDGKSRRETQSSEVEEDDNEYVTKMQEREDERSKEDVEDWNVQKEVKIPQETQVSAVSSSVTPNTTNETVAKRRVEKGKEDEPDVKDKKEPVEDERDEEEREEKDKEDGPDEEVREDVGNPRKEQVLEVGDERNENVTKRQLEEQHNQDVSVDEGRKTPECSKQSIADSSDEDEEWTIPLQDIIRSLDVEEKNIHINNDKRISDEEWRLRHQIDKTINIPISYSDVKKKSNDDKEPNEIIVTKGDGTDDVDSDDSKLEAFFVTQRESRSKK